MTNKKQEIINGDVFKNARHKASSIMETFDMLIALAKIPHGEAVMYRRAMAHDIRTLVNHAVSDIQNVIARIDAEPKQESETKGGGQ